MARTSHPKKEIEQALKHAEANGWRIKVGASHAWGKMYCPDDAGCRGGKYCITSVWSTPKNAGQHAGTLKRAVDNCTANKHHNDDGSSKE
ncbi:hypothetical protein F2P44_23505 [Massilia sp. CCM 8695]|uniref:Uncharacterized protein n=1 Tax=Massilia frigida TaxID=2609281 RepID=A0ABX0NH08_9BURK|nr:hypothetical protein [Massilia frigida]NHZ82222.1 hypothetical protein [Massilia frigida]